MRKFSFPLEGAARVRELRVKSCQAELARTQLESKEAEEESRLAEEAIRRSVQSAPQGMMVQVQHLVERDNCMRRLKADARMKEENLKRTLTEVEEGRARLVEARRGARAVEKIRERRYVEFLKAVLSDEQKMTDETASRSHRGKEAA